MFGGPIVVKPVIEAMAKVPMKWVAFNGEEGGLPFDLDELRRLCESA